MKRATLLTMGIVLGLGGLPAWGQDPDVTAELRVDSVSPLRLTVRLTNQMRRKLTLYYADDHEYQLRIMLTDAATECQPTPFDHQRRPMTIRRRKTAERTFECRRFLQHGASRRELPPGTYSARFYYEYNGTADGMWRGAVWSEPVEVRIPPLDADLSAPRLTNIPEMIDGDGWSASLDVITLGVKPIAQGRELRPEEPTPTQSLIATTLQVVAQAPMDFDDWALFLAKPDGTLLEAADCTAQLDGEMWFGLISRRGKTQVTLAPYRLRPLPLTTGATYHLVVRLRRDKRVYWLRSAPTRAVAIPLTPEEMMVP